MLHHAHSDSASYAYRIRRKQAEGHRRIRRNLWRRLALPRRIENWSLTSLQQRLVKTGGRLVRHARYYWLFLAEGHLNRQGFRAMMGRIALLPVRAG